MAAVLININLAGTGDGSRASALHLMALLALYEDMEPIIRDMVKTINVRFTECPGDVPNMYISAILNNNKITEEIFFSRAIDPHAFVPEKILRRLSRKIEERISAGTA